MPVVLREVNAQALADQPSWRIDLQKIYAEADPQRLSLGAGPLTVDDFIEQAILPADNWFAGALFNDHLIGALLVTMTPDEWQVQHLCVRTVTRRRGVGSRLMALLAAQARSRSRLLRVPDIDLTLADQMLFRRLGYSPCPGGNGFILANALN